MVKKMLLTASLQVLCKGLHLGELPRKRDGNTQESEALGGEASADISVRVCRSGALPFSREGWPGGRKGLKWKHLVNWHTLRGDIAPDCHRSPLTTLQHKAFPLSVLFSTLISADSHPCYAGIQKTALKKWTFCDHHKNPPFWYFFLHPFPEHSPWQREHIPYWCARRKFMALSCWKWSLDYSCSS